MLVSTCLWHAGQSVLAANVIDRAVWVFIAPACRTWLAALTSMTGSDCAVIGESAVIMFEHTHTRYPVCSFAQGPSGPFCAERLFCCCRCRLHRHVFDRLAAAQRCAREKNQPQFRQTGDEHIQRVVDPQVRAQLTGSSCWATVGSC